MGQIKTIVKYAIILVVIAFSSCNRNVIYSKYVTFNDNEWSSKNNAIFDVDIKDAQNMHDISLMIRHADSYSFNNIFLFVTTKYPDGKILTDTMEVVLANAKGKWMGSGAGDIFDLKVPIKQRTKFPMPGKYQFTFQQGMRQDPLQMIMDFGFEIKQTNK
ncbi:MAG: gliding motility lipoprotein GldH [Bacteroidetes bacterium]|nr:gliding motility lipoprotein GldH [Bacteroidota bacterium]